METMGFLMECTQSLPDAEAIAARITGAIDDDDITEVEAVANVSHDDDDDGIKCDQNAVSSGCVIDLPYSVVHGGDVDKTMQPKTSVEVSATTPRSKFDLTLHNGTGLILRNKKDEAVHLPSSSVEQVLLFPKAEDCRAGAGGRKKGPSTRPGLIALITLKDSNEVAFRGKKLKNVCFQLPKSIIQLSGVKNDEDFELEENKEGIHSNEDETEANDVELQWVNLLGKAFGLSSEKIVLVSNPAYLTDDDREARAFADRYAFKSDETEGTSTTTAGMPYVKCYEGVNDGVLYPLEEGLLFFKPTKFIPRGSLHSITCGRGGGNSRYVDLVATLEGEDGEGGESVEFSNIAREEVRVLNDYIHKVLIKAMAKDVGNTDVVAGGDDDTDTNDREACATESDQDEGRGGSRKRSRRAASKDAREATKAQLRAIDKAGQNEVDEDDSSDGEDFLYAAAGESESESSDAGEETESEDEDDGSSDDENEEMPSKKTKKL